jgi:hypothetical protein
MANPPLSPEVHKLIYDYAQAGYSIDGVRRVLLERHGLKIAHGTVFKFKQIPPCVPDGVKLSGAGIKSNKKRGSMDWREWSAELERLQQLKRRGSHSQDTAFIELGDGSRPVAIAGFSDQHMGSWGCNYKELVSLTDELLNTRDLYIGLLGDYGQYSIKLRSVLEVMDNALPPEQQTQFVESWFGEIWHKVAFATWDNHAVERQEKLAGESGVKKLLSKKVVYFNGIGHLEIKVGSQIYRGAVSHAFRGRSMLNPVHACMRYMRFEGVDREFAMMGDSHVPGMAKYTDGAVTRVATNNGSLQNNSGYAKRYFSLTTHPVFPIIVFHPDRHEMTPFWSIKEWLAVRGR